MNELLTKILSSPEFTSLLGNAVLLIAGYAVWWLRKKTSAVQVLNDNWTYAEPIVTAAVDIARKAAAEGRWSSAILQDLTVKGLAALGDKFRLHEGVEPPKALLDAVASDIEATVRRAVGEVQEAVK